MQAVSFYLHFLWKTRENLAVFLLVLLCFLLVLFTYTPLLYLHISESQKLFFHQNWSPLKSMSKHGKFLISVSLSYEYSHISSYVQMSFISVLESPVVTV